MARETLNDLVAFLTVAREGSFTRAAAKMGLSQSALSHTLRGLEARLGVRLLNRSTRSLSPTQAGERLLQSLGPKFDEIDAELAALSALREKPAGTVRITTVDHAARTILWPKLSPLLRDYPDITLELSVDYALTDIVAERFDAGVRLGEQVAKDMIAIPIGPPQRIAVAASPDYFRRHPVPTSPRDLVTHACINLRLPTKGGLMLWEFERKGEILNVHVDGPLVLNTADMIRTACIDGHGLAYLPEDILLPAIQDGRLIRVLEDWCDPYPGYHLYYTSRRQPSPAFALVVESLRLKP